MSSSESSDPGHIIGAVNKKRIKKIGLDTASKMSDKEMEAFQKYTGTAYANINETLTGKQKQEIKEKTGWSDEIINSMGSMKEVEIYINAGLQEVKVAGKKCLIKDNIDLNLIDEDGISNREKMKRGKPALTKDGQVIELHHIGQKPDSSLAELTIQEHRGVGNDTILHDKGKKSEIDRNEFAKERKNHWKFRAEEGV